jgi:hypothetical protein
MHKIHFRKPPEKLLLNLLPRAAVCAGPFLLSLAPGPVKKAPPQKQTQSPHTNSLNSLSEHISLSPSLPPCDGTLLGSLFTLGYRFRVLGFVGALCEIYAINDTLFLLLGEISSKYPRATARPR